MVIRMTMWTSLTVSSSLLLSCVITFRWWELIVLFCLCIAHSFHSVHDEDNDEDTDEHWFVPEWGLHNDLQIFSFRAYKEMISHLATPAEDKILSNLTNYKLVRHTYQSLGRSILSQAELLKRHERLNHDNLELLNRYETQLEELNCLRNDYQRKMQKNEGLSKKLVLLENAHLQCSDKETELNDKLKHMEQERDKWR
ncbi:hypothetical protein Tco_0702947 [Tanacetum coccineum]|uniref:Uncharacterized protein n=1 Tax=Tanacetum coccineum TaxID=301880 RepID=A0ABQ4XXZ8_9ASTR